MGKKILEARVLTESALLELFDALKSAASPEEFLGNVDAILASPGNHLPLPVDPGVPDRLSLAGKRSVDIDNAPRVHEYLGEMDRANASDARLWTYLAFVTYREYMDERWSLTGLEKWKDRVRSRWLLHSGSVTRGRLVRHGIARLWWVSHLTFAKAESEGIAKDDKYAYTKEAFKSEDRLNALFDREVGAFPVVIKAVLSHAATMGDAATDNHIRRIMQYLTLINGYRDMGMLDLSTMNDLVKAASLRTP